LFLEQPNYLKSDFTNNLKDALADSEVRKTVSDTLGSYTGPNAASQISSFGIGVCLAFLGQFLVTKKRTSPAVRFIARILGTNVDAINRDHVLQKLKDKDFSDTVREKVLNVIQTSSIDEFAKAVNLSPGEAWEVYRQIKDLIIDSKVVDMVSQLQSESSLIETAISTETQALRADIDRQQQQQLNEILKLQYGLYQTNGLYWLSRNYFEDNISTTEDTENWKNGFAFQLPSIMQEKEFRRNALLNEIKRRLEIRNRLLLVGESGTSKTTILMEILADYFAEGYEIFYNLEGNEIKNGPLLVSFIQNRLKSGDKVLVIVDDVHFERTSTIFYAMDQILSSFRFIQNVRFLLAARIPEYDSFVEERLNKVAEGKESIRKFSKDPEFRYDLSYFTADEIKGFIKKYIGMEFSLPMYFEDSNGHRRSVSAEDEGLLSNVSEAVLNYTRGHPIMVKFYLLGGGLRTDVERRYNDYLSGHSRRLQLMLVCLLLDMGSLSITDDLLKDMGLLREAYSIKNATLYQPREGFWKTIHPRWGEELLSFLYNHSDEGRIYDNKQHLKDALDTIFYTKPTQERVYLVIGIIYNILARHVIPIEIIESITNIPDYLTNKKKAEIYTYYIGQAYITLEKFENAIHKLDEALKFRPDFIDAWYNKGTALGSLGKYEDAIEAYEQTISIEHHYANAWYNKGVAHSELGEYCKAIESFDKAIMHRSGLRDQAYSKAWYNKGITLYKLGEYKKAIESINESIKIDHNDPDSWYNRACFKVKTNQIEDGLSDLEQAIKLGGEKYIKKATEDPDFETVKNDPHFKKLTSNDNDIAQQQNLKTNNV
jgi:tetratricopeptide (TPR) repeat protein